MMMLRWRWRTQRTEIWSIWPPLGCCPYS